MAYDTALLTTAAEVAALTGRANIDNLASSGFVLADFLLEAHRWVYRKLEFQGIDPTSVTNQARLHTAIAMRAVALLVGGNYLDSTEGATAEFYQAAAEREVSEYVPTYSTTTDKGRSAGEDSPALGNFEDGTWHLGDSPGRFDFRTKFPRRL